MTVNSREKGVRGERELARIFQEAGLEVRNLEQTGDHLIVCGNGLTLHVECKRRERVRVQEWAKQAEAEAPQGTIPVVGYRASTAAFTKADPWRVVLRAEDLVALLVSRSEGTGSDESWFKPGEADAIRSRSEGTE